MASNKKKDAITNVTGRELDPHGRFDAMYNRPKRFFRTFFRKYFVPSIITAGLAVAAVVAFPIFSTAASLTVGNLALVGAGAFTATSCAIGTGSLINNKWGASRRVKKALKKGGDAQAALFDSLENEPKFKNGRLYYADNQRRPAIKGKAFWRRRDELWEYLKQNRHNSAGRFSNRELVQRIIDNDDTKYVVDLVMLAAKKGYLGEEQKAYANRENMKALKNLKYLTESEADELLEGMLGIDNHMRTEGVDTYNQTSSSSSATRKFTRDSDLTPAQERALQDLIAEENARKEIETAELLRRQNNLKESLVEHNSEKPATTPTIEEKHLVERMMGDKLVNPEEKVFNSDSSSLTGKMLSDTTKEGETVSTETPVEISVAYVPSVAEKKAPTSKPKVELTSNLRPEDRIL